MTARQPVPDLRVGERGREAERQGGNEAGRRDAEGGGYERTEGRDYKTSVKSECEAWSGDARSCHPVVFPHEPLALRDIPVRPEHKPDTSSIVQPR